MIKRPESIHVFLLMSLALLFSIYWISRYGGWAVEGDATRLTIAAESIVNENRLVTKLSYSNGFGYPVLLTFLNMTTSLPIQLLQIVGSVWLVVISVTSYLVYKELLQKSYLSTVAVLLLLLQPDFLFYVLRSSHERITWTFGTLILWLWIRTACKRLSKNTLRIGNIVAVYFLLWAMITTNVYFGSTIVTMFLLAVCVNRFINWLSSRISIDIVLVTIERRMLYPLLSGAVLIFIFITYIYLPARNYYFTLQSFVDRVAAVVLGAESMAEPYYYVQNAWVSPTTYLLLTSLQWIIVVAALAAWFRDGFAILRQGATSLPLPRLLLWLFFFGFGGQLALGIVSDFSGVLGSNLQVRLFTPLVLLATPIAVTWLDTVKQLPIFFKQWLRILSVSGICFAVVAVLLKVTNDPLVGNQWIFYSPAEQEAMEWVDEHLMNRGVWVDTFAHQVDVFRFRKGYDWHPSNDYYYGFMEGGVLQRISHILLSDLTIHQANRSHLELPPIVSYHTIYDGGRTKFYQRPPKTPFQR